MWRKFIVYGATRTSLGQMELVCLRSVIPVEKKSCRTPLIILSTREARDLLSQQSSLHHFISMFAGNYIRTDHLLRICELLEHVCTSLKAHVVP